MILNLDPDERAALDAHLTVYLSTAYGTDDVPLLRSVLAKVHQGGLGVVPVLTKREMEMLPHIAEGATLTEMAARFYLSEGTVKSHRSSIFMKLGVNNAAAAVNRAHLLHLLGPGPDLTPDARLALMRQWLTDPDVARALLGEVRP